MARKKPNWEEMFNEFADSYLEEIAKRAWLYWKEIARTELRASKDVYVWAVQKRKVGPANYEVGLQINNEEYKDKKLSFLPKRVEVGYELESMLPRMLRSDLRKKDLNRHVYLKITNFNPDHVANRENIGKVKYVSRFKVRLEKYDPRLLRTGHPYRGWPLKIKARKFRNRVWEYCKGAIEEGEDIGMGEQLSAIRDRLTNKIKFAFKKLTV